jgi:hypothetical protein
MWVWWILGGDNPMQIPAWPKCRKCGEGDLVPLSDYGTEGASITYKAWVCTNPGCCYNLKIHKGNLYVNEPVNTRQTSYSLNDAR